MNIADDDGVTPLHLAVKWGYLEIVRELVNAGSRVDAKNKYGATPLHMAAWNGPTVSDPYPREIEGTKIVELLLENGADINAKDSEGRTPLAVAEIGDSREGRDEKVVALLRSKGGIE